LDSRVVLPVNTVLDDDYRILRVVGSGGFGITYEAEDINLGTLVAIKEYYPVDFGDRNATMSVRPKSERHKQTFERGRLSFLEEARTLARFEHPSIVRVTRVFEWKSNAYMVMRFEQGQSFEAWLSSLARLPTQEELDSVTFPLLDALQVMHAANFLHRDIAPDNIIIRTDGTPVLLDFGAARRAIAEMSRSITGIVKAGYSPHEQYAVDGRLQGPWSDLYALGASLYRAVTGRPPEEATLRMTDDRMPPAAQVGKGTYRPGVLAAVDACLNVVHTERPQSVAQLRPMLLGAKSQPKGTERVVEPTYKLPRERAPPAGRASTVRQVARRWPAIAAMIAVIAGAYGGYEYRDWNATQTGTTSGKAERSAAEGEAQRQAALDLERRQKEKEAADARQRQIEIDEAKRRKELAAAAEAEARRKADTTAEVKRKEEQRIAALEEARRKSDETRRKAETDEARRKDEAAAEDKLKEERHIAALEESRGNEEKRKEDERLRLAAIPDDEKRAEFVREIQQVLKRSRCYDGALNGRSSDAQEGVNKFVENANKRGKAKPGRIELAKATVGDFESWLRDADDIKGGVCTPKAKPERQEKVPRPREAQAAQPQAAAKSPGLPSGSDRPGRGGTCSGWMFYNTSCVDAGGRRCTQTPGGRKCE
jgi:tRNA A-37 threonylcarbamoyl transferase component Bud32